MKNKNLSLQQFIKKLKTVDVGDLLEKAKGINVEDIRSIKFSNLKDITKSDYFYPSLGIFFASLTSILFLFPSIDSLKNRQSKSAQYKQEKLELPVVDEELKKREEAKIKIDVQIKNLTDLIPDKGNIVFLTEILYDASKRAGAEIVEFLPISVDDLNSCRSSKEQDFFNNDFSNDMSYDNFDDNQNFENYENEYYTDGLQAEENNEKLEVYEFYPNDIEIIKEFESLKKDISSIYESNYFLLNIKSDYLKSLNFLRYLQEYKIAILPYCFEPKMSSNTSNEDDIENSSLNGEINARIIVNIPNLK